MQDIVFNIYNTKDDKVSLILYAKDDSMWMSRSQLETDEAQGLIKVIPSKKSID